MDAYRELIAGGGKDHVHIIPAWDLKEHEASGKCWCKPTPDDEEPAILVHHSMDGREAFEDGTRFVS